MNIAHTIDAFIDGQTVDTPSLDTALASSEGRAYLIDALALRQLLAETPAAAVTPGRRGRTLHFYARAAVVAVGLVGLGYAAGIRDRAIGSNAPPATAQLSDAPEPTRVIELAPGVNWHESKGGD